MCHFLIPGAVVCYFSWSCSVFLHLHCFRILLDNNFPVVRKTNPATFMISKAWILMFFGHPQLSDRSLKYHSYLLECQYEGIRSLWIMTFLNHLYLCVFVLQGPRLTSPWPSTSQLPMVSLLINTHLDTQSALNAWGAFIQIYADGRIKCFLIALSITPGGNVLWWPWLKGCVINLPLSSVVGGRLRLLSRSY